MPGMGGLDVIRHLRQMENWQRPIIVISANVFDRDREQASSAGCNGFVFKPVHLTDMLEQLQLHLSLQWIHAGESREDNPDPQEVRATPPPDSLIALREHARIGYIKGVTGEIERISALDPAYRSFAEQLRQLAREFRTADIVNLVEETLRNEPDRARA
jgi:response regulator RpfG family c-di-GMP phosphodiesterase